jgi:hypothetical protein
VRFLLKYGLIKGDIMKNNIKKAVYCDIDSQIASIRNGFEERESKLKKGIMIVYGEVQVLSEGEFIEKLVDLEIRSTLRQIDLLHNLASHNPDLLDEVKMIGKEDNLFDSLTILEQIDSLAMKIISLRKNGFPAEQKEEYLEIYRHFKAMSIEDLQEYILRCVKEQLDAANEEIARLDRIKDTFSPGSR